MELEATPQKWDAEWSIRPITFNQRVLTYKGVNAYSASQFETALRLVESGQVRVAPLITHRFSLDDYQQAFETSDKRKDGAIKVVIQVHKEN